MPTNIAANASVTLTNLSTAMKPQLPADRGIGRRCTGNDGQRRCAEQRGEPAQRGVTLPQRTPRKHVPSAAVIDTIRAASGRLVKSVGSLSAIS